jgi:hypothetical protein
MGNNCGTCGSGSAYLFSCHKRHKCHKATFSPYKRRQNRIEGLAVVAFLAVAGARNATTWSSVWGAKAHGHPVMLSAPLRVQNPELQEKLEVSKETRQTRAEPLQGLPKRLAEDFEPSTAKTALHTRQALSRLAEAFKPIKRAKNDH